MMLSLANKQIVLAITGGIAAYKSAELCRLLIRAGAEVRVVMTRAAMEFITPLTLQALSGKRVHSELLDAEAEAAMGHIELARWADLVLVAPASANCLAQLAAGEARDLLGTLVLATRAPVALAPAMNQAMWSNASTRENLARLLDKGMKVFGPAEGEQACGDVGPGRMLEPQTIAEAAAALFETGALAGKRVLITAGPTREAIDPIRYISNHSSGKMGYALAQAALEAGAGVALVSGPVSLTPPARARLINVESAAEMLAACQGEEADIFIAVAAVADYRPESSAVQKLKKSAAKMSLQLVRNPDILQIMADSPQRPFCVGFAAETENLEEHARAKLKNKNADLIFANLATETFGQDSNNVSAYWHEGYRDMGTQSKAQLARAMIGMIAERLAKA